MTRLPEQEDSALPRRFAKRTSPRTGRLEAKLLRDWTFPNGSGLSNNTDGVPAGFDGAATRNYSCNIFRDLLLRWVYE